MTGTNFAPGEPPAPCNPTRSSLQPAPRAFGLQPHACTSPRALQPATPCAPACNPVCSSLQPYVFSGEPRVRFGSVAVVAATFVTLPIPLSLTLTLTLTLTLP